MPGNQIDSFHKEIVRKYRGRSGLKTFVGMQYSPYQSDKYRQDHEGYMDVLEAFKSTYQSSASTISGQTNDTFLYSGGLHHIFHGHFNVPATVTMIMRTICQVGLVFPGHILLRSPNVIQQHQYPVVDISSLNVRHLNWELQSRLRTHDHSLVDLLCCLYLYQSKMWQALSHYLTRMEVYYKKMWLIQSYFNNTIIPGQ